MKKSIFISHAGLRAVAVVLAVVSLLFLCAGRADAEASGELAWSVSEDGTLTISGSVIPNYGYSNRAPWFNYRYTVTSLKISEGVTSIGSEAFSDFQELTNVTLPSTLEVIGAHAFSDCVELKQILLPDGLRTISSGAFYGCSDLATIWIPSSVRTIGYNPFAKCTKLHSLAVHKSNPCYKDEGNVLFTADGTKLICYPLSSSGKQYEVPEGVVSIGENAFLAAENLKAISLPASLKEVRSSAFDECLNLVDAEYAGTRAEFGDIQIYSGNLYLYRAYRYVTKMSGDCGYDAQWSLSADCKVLTITGTGWVIQGAVDGEWNGYINASLLIERIVVSEGITGIGNWAFADCARVTSVSLPSTLTSIAHGAFHDCIELWKLDYNGTNAQWNQIEIGDENNPIHFARTCAQDFTWTLKNGVLTLSGHGAMPEYHEIAAPWDDQVASVTSAVIGNGLTTIGTGVFYGCSNMKTVSIPSTMTAISSSAFAFCSSLDNVVIPSSVREICEYAFYGCTGLTHISIPSPVETIGYEAFYECSNLASVTLAEGLNFIDSDAFFGCTSLVQIRIPASVTGLGEDLFNGCTALKQLTVASGNRYYKAVNNVLFNADMTLLIGCAPAAITGNYEIPEGVVKLCWGAFNSCTGLTGITFPSGVQEVASYAFYNCTSLTDVWYDDTTGETTLVYAGNECLMDAEWHYFYTDGLLTISLPAYTTTVEAEAFAGNAAQRIVVPATVTSIGSKAFVNCRNLQVLCFQGSPADIANDILSGCRNVIIQCRENSTAYRWAQSNGYPVKIIN